MSDPAELSPMHTTRLTLRPLKETDNRALSILRSDESVNRYLDRPPSCNLQEADAFIMNMRNAADGPRTYWVLTQSGKDELIGTICLWNFSDDGQVAEIGYELLPAWQGRGLMKEALSQVLSFGFSTLGLSRILAFSAKDNARSAGLLKNAGFLTDEHHMTTSAEEAGVCNVFFLNKSQKLSDR